MMLAYIVKNKVSTKPLTYKDDIHSFVTVLSCTQGDIIRNNTNGILKYCNAGTWNSICADYWTNSHATVACKQLGYSNQGQLS